jgi:hypothetical protein
LGCWRWGGDVTTAYSDLLDGRTETTVTKVVFANADELTGSPVPTVGAFALKNATSETTIGGGSESHRSTTTTICTYSGHDSWAWDNNALLSHQLKLVPHADAGAKYRKYELGGTATSGHTVTYTANCTTTDEETGEQTSSSATLSTAANVWPSSADAKGPVSGDGATITGTADSGGTHYDWNFKSQREP